MGSQIHFMDGLDNGTERRAVVDLERGSFKEEFAGGGKTGQVVQAFNGGPDRVKELISGQRDKISPGLFRPRAGEDAFVFFIERSELLVLFANLAAGDQSQLVRLLRLMGNGNLPGATACALLRSGVA